MGRGGTHTITCHTDGCRKTTSFAYDSQREAKELLRTHYYTTWKCPRHSNPERYLTQDNPANQVVLVATDGYYTNYKGEEKRTGRYWYPQGATTGSGNAVEFSAAHYADAENFPPGTRLVITAYTETPEQADAARSADGEVS